MLGEAGAAAEAAFARVLQRYRETSGHGPYVVEGSSAGALQFWPRVVRLERSKIALKRHRKTCDRHEPH